MDRERAKNYALRLLGIRPRSVKELRDRLLAKGAELNHAQQVVADLAEVGLLDDAKFARSWVEGRLALRPMGTARLKQELRAKGIEPATIDEVLGNFTREVDQTELALQLASSKSRTYGSLGRESQRRRLAGFLARRGFSSSVISAVLKKIRSE